MNNILSYKSILLLLIVLILLIIFFFTINYFIPYIQNKNNLIKVRDFTNNKIINKSDYIYKFNPYNNKWLRDDWENRYKLNSPPLIYNYSWFNPLYWNSPVCKRGCIQTDIGQWGCQYPGYSSNDCFFASDCRGC